MSMQSKIIIDFDTEGQPLIRISYKYSEDVRDRLVYRWLAKMGIISEGRTGFWCYARLGHESRDEGAVVFLEPMNEHILGLHFPQIQNVLAQSSQTDKLPIPPAPPLSISMEFLANELKKLNEENPSPFYDESIKHLKIMSSALASQGQ